jgi:AraC-like DNA-binding protein
MQVPAISRTSRAWRLGSRLRQGALEAAWLADAEPRGQAIAAGAVLLAELQGCAAHGEVIASAHGGEPFDAVTLVLGGTLAVREGTHRLVCGTGDVLLWNCGQSGSFEVSDGLRVLHFLVPQSLARRCWPALVVGAEPQVCTSVRWAVMLAVAGATALWEQRGKLAAHELEAAAASVLDLLARSGAMEPGERRQRLAHVMALVDRQLGDPELGPTRLATELGMSVRTLHALLARHQLTVCSLIRSRRLECCRAALAEAPADASVADIGSRFGLVDAAHFSRLFKRAYGTGPREYRQRLRQPLGQ